MQLKTDRLLIRELVPDDWRSMQKIAIDFRKSKYAIYDMSLPIENEKIAVLTQQFAETQLFYAVLFDNVMIGYICFHEERGNYDLGFCFHSDYHGKGYALENCSAVMEYMAKERKVKAFTAGTALKNKPSCKLLDKLGFTLKETELLSFHKNANGNGITFEGGIFIKSESCNMIEEVFKNRKLNREKLLSFGFEKVNNGYIYHTDLVGGQMKLTVTIDTEGTIHSGVVDNTSGDEYVLHRVAGVAGPFVGQVKTEFETVLEEISETCFDPEKFKSTQSKAVIAYVRDTYGDELEYLWQKFPDNAVVRRKDNRKWYVALLTVSRRKLGFDSDEPAEILDLRIKPEEIETTVDHIRFLPGYHMNKKHWITICLDETVNIEEIYRRIDQSYNLAQK